MIKTHILGVSAGFHDASITLIDSQGNVVFAGHSERYSKIKNDPLVHQDLMNEVKDYDISHIAFYERPWVHKLRQLFTGEKSADPWTLNGALAKYIKPLKDKVLGRHWDRIAIGTEFPTPHPFYSYNHHLCHAAAGFQTSPFDRACVVVIDAIGEFDTVSIYRAWYDENGRAKYKRVWSQKYPHSIGLFYSAMTQRAGLKPMEEEYILMGMSAYGKDTWYPALSNRVVDNYFDVTLKENFHIGAEHLLPEATDEDIACATQMVAEDLIMKVMNKAYELTGETNLVYMGGVALNCLANRLLGDIFDDIWIMPNPGDAGSSLGAAALAYGGRVNWTTAYLGHDIPGDYPVDDIIDELLTQQIVGVASGRAEFGPRALGNRSLLADPRGSEIKDKVNEIKRRQKFRPFAPVILEEHVDSYFDMPSGWSDSRYMQVIARCRHRDLFPAIVHHDGTSRVQTVPPDGSGIRKLLEAWYAKTGCPMLLNTSLNIRGEPMVNDRADADRFEQLYGVKVCS